MTKISIKAEDILNKACDIIVAARKDLGIKTPSYVKSDFKYEIQTKHEKVLKANKVSMDIFGALFGNKTRWDADLCRFFTLSFIQFFIAEAKNPINIDVLQFYKNTSAEKYRGIPLLHYDEAEYSEAAAFSKPTLFVADPRVISMKAYVVYPNTSLSRRFGSTFEAKKWINMRYLLVSEKPSVSKIPKFYYDLTDLKVKPRISETPGFLLKFSYCELASYLKTLTFNCFQILSGDAPTHDMRVAKKVLDLVNVILKTSIEFEISPYVKPSTPAPSAYRINPAPQPVYIKFPEMRDDEAFIADGLLLEDISLYDLVPEDADTISAEIFTTTDFPRVSVGPYVQWTHTPTKDNVQLLEEDEFLEVFNGLNL